MPHVARWCSENARELIFTLGLLLLAGGLACVYTPAAFIVAGLILVWLAIPPSTRPRKPS